jgi:sugar O-acyltransferase (sialic acid O-acetyltransferase NeuD family)
MRPIVILGAGGHGREVAEVLRDRKQAEPSVEVLGYVDDNRALRGKQLNGLPVLGDWSWFDGVDRSEIEVVCAAGTPSVLRSLADRAGRLGLSFARVISPRAYVAPTAVLGAGVTLFAHAVVQPDVRLGDHCILNLAATVSHDSVVGACTNINPGAHLAGNVVVGEGCYIGMGANVIQGRTVGAGAVIGAGAVVVADVPPAVTAVGVPARVIKRHRADADDTGGRSR